MCSLASAERLSRCNQPATVVANNPLFATECCDFCLFATEAGDVAAESGAKVRRCGNKNKKKTRATNLKQLKHFLQATWEELHALEAEKEHMDEQIALLLKKGVALDVAVKACRSKLDSVCRQEPLMIGEVGTV